MTTSTTTCDRCGSVTELGRVKLLVVVGEFKAGSVDHATGRTVVDLCTSCSAAVAGFVATKPRAS
jgi:hypothetical protein